MIILVLDRRTSTSVSSDDCPVASKTRRRMSPLTIPRPVPTIIPQIPVFPPLFGTYPLVPNPTIPATIALPFTAAQLTNRVPSITQPVPPAIAGLTTRNRALQNDEPIGARTRRKKTKIWKPYAH